MKTEQEIVDYLINQILYYERQYHYHKKLYEEEPCNEKLNYPDMVFYRHCLIVINNVLEFINEKEDQ